VPATVASGVEGYKSGQLEASIEDGLVVLLRVLLQHFVVLGDIELHQKLADLPAQLLQSGLHAAKVAPAQGLGVPMSLAIKRKHSKVHCHVRLHEFL
jgi:hypothetical protein